MPQLLTLFNLYKNPQGRIISAILGMAVAFGIVYALGNTSTLFMLSILLIFITIFESGKLCKDDASKCDNIMLDNIAGVFMALVFALSNTHLSSNREIIIATIIALIAYIGMDRYKPSTIKWLRNNVKGALGITLSSTLAGIAGGFVSILVMYAI